ncbi:MAG: HEAT repeat domain-containing protein [Ktedonobacteraceae bacterium]|nr:HEAT repeat domain-containing protein [Ktedonobacteraceae bacterium]
MNQSQPNVQALLEDCSSGDPDKQVPALIELIKRHEESAVLGIIPLLSSSDEGVRAEAARALGFLGYPAREQIGPGLLELLGDPDERVRDEAALALGSLVYEPAVDTLKHLVHHDPSWVVRASVAEALGNFADESILGDLEEVLRSEKEEAVKGYAATSLGLIASPAYQPKLAVLLKRTRAFPVKNALLAASYRLGGQEHLEPLLAMLQTSDENETVVALQNIQDIVEQKQPPTLSQDAPRIREALEAIPGRFPLEGPQVREILVNLERLEADNKSS